MESVQLSLFQLPEFANGGAGHAPASQLAPPPAHGDIRLWVPASIALRRPEIGLHETGRLPIKSTAGSDRFTIDPATCLADYRQPGIWLLAACDPPGFWSLTYIHLRDVAVRRTR